MIDKKEILNLLNKSYKQGRLDFRNCIIEAYQKMINLNQNMTADELIEAIKLMDSE